DRNSDRGLHGVHSFRVALRARLRPPPRSTLFPYTTLFRSLVNSEHPSLEKLCLLEVLSGDLHEVNAWFGWIFDEHFCVVFAVFLGFAANARLVRSGLVRIEQGAALVQPEPFVGGPAWPLGTDQRVRATPIDQASAKRVLARSAQSDRAAQPTACRDLSERITQPAHSAPV